MRITFTLTALLLVTFLALSAQTYLPIPSTGARFKVEQNMNEPIAGCSWAGASFEYTDGDTIVDSLPVVKVRMGAAVTCYELGPPCGGVVYPGIMGYLLQDTVGRVYLKQPGQLPKLLMDFSLSVGDTVGVGTYDMCYSTCIIDSVDTVTYVDAIPRKRLFVNHPCMLTTGQSIWVEGIGDLNGGLLPYGGFESFVNPICFMQDSLHLVDCLTPLFCPAADCNILLAEDQREDLTPLGIHPNPGSDRFTLTGMNGQALQVTLLDATGRELMSRTVISGEEVPVDGLPAGLYHVRVNAGGQTSVLKWMQVR